jgi:hypothetical protein
MTQEFLIRLNWEGSETIEAIKPMLHQPCRIEVTLAANYHHALFRHFHPAAPAAQFEVLDEQGGAELLTTLAEIEGLQLFAELGDAVVKSQATVHVTGPAMVIIEVPRRRISQVS